MNSDHETEPSFDQVSSLRKFYPRRIAVMQALPGLGDMLWAAPAWRALRTAWPMAHITLIGLPWVNSFVGRFKAYLDSFLAFPGYPGLSEPAPSIRRLPAFLAEVQGRAFDLAIQMHGSGLVANPFTMLLGAQITAGFFLPGQYCPDERYFLPYPAHESEVRRPLCLLEFLGIPSQGEALEFPLYEADWKTLYTFEEVRALRPGGYVCLHPGASTFERCWPAERFAAIADELAAQGLQVVLTGSTKEIVLTQTVSRMMRADCLDLAGRTSLGALAALLSNARLVICHDSGISHLAAALQVPSVIIFTQPNPPISSAHPYHDFDTSQDGDCLCLGNGCLALTQSLKELPPTNMTVEMILAQVESRLSQPFNLS